MTNIKDIKLDYELKKLKDDFEETDVQVAPGIWQSKEDYEANMAYDSMRDNEM